MTKVQKRLAENIKFYRKQKGMTQEDLAEKAGAATNYIGTIEIGKKFPSPKMIERLALALGIDELSLFSESNESLPVKNMEKIEKLLLENISETVRSTFISIGHIA